MLYSTSYSLLVKLTEELKWSFFCTLKLRFWQLFIAASCLVSHTSSRVSLQYLISSRVTAFLAPDTQLDHLDSIFLVNFQDTALPKIEAFLTFFLFWSPLYLRSAWVALTLYFPCVVLHVQDRCKTTLNFLPCIESVREKKIHQEMFLGRHNTSAFAI